MLLLFILSLFAIASARGTSSGASFSNSTITAASSTASRSAWSSDVTSSHNITVVPWVEHETFAIVNGSTYYSITLTGGQTSEVTFTRFLRESLVLSGGTISALPQKTGRCSGGGRDGAKSSFLSTGATYKSTTTLTKGETLDWIPDPDGTQEFQTFKGPTTVELLKTLPFEGPQLPQNRAGVLDTATITDDSCYSLCAGCRFYYPSVSVKYWPGESVNTACVTDAKNQKTKDQKVKFRALRPRAVNVTSTTIASNTSHGSIAVENGFTYTSPSIYIEFPTFFAWDNCGLLGSSTTFMTRSYHPDQVSSIVYASDFRSSTFSFDFANAECPPESIANNDAWFALAKDARHYNPIIAGPADLTDIDPMFKSCSPGVFQGHDPPNALTPANNLMPNPTPAASTAGIDPSPAASTTAGPLETAVFQPKPQPNLKLPVSKSSTSTKPASALPHVVDSSSDPAKPVTSSKIPEAQDSAVTAQPLKSEAPTIVTDGDVPDPSSSDASPPSTPNGASVSSTPRPPAQEEPKSNEANESTSQAKPVEPAESQQPSRQADPQPLEQFSPTLQSPDPAPAPQKPASETTGSLPDNTDTEQPSSDVISSGSSPEDSGSNDGSSKPAVSMKPPATTRPEVETTQSEESGDLSNQQDPGTPENEEQQSPTQEQDTAVADSPAGVSITKVPAQEPTPAPFVLPGEVVTANSKGDFVIDSETFRAGETATVAGVAITVPASQPAAPSAADVELGASGPAVEKSAAASGDTSGSDSGSGSGLEPDSSLADELQQDSRPSSQSDTPVAPGDSHQAASSPAASQSPQDNPQPDPQSDFTPNSQQQDSSPNLATPTDDTLHAIPHTLDSAYNIIINSQTFPPGATATLPNTILTLPSAIPSYNAPAILNPSLNSNPNSNPDSNPNPTLNTASVPAPAILTLPASTYTPNTAAAYIIDATTYAAGATATLRGSLVTLPSATPAAASTSATVAPGAVDASELRLTVAGTTYTASSGAAALVVAGQTLSRGGQVVVGSSTVRWAARPSGNGTDEGEGGESVGGAVASGLEGGLEKGGPGQSAGSEGATGSDVQATGSGEVAATGTQDGDGDGVVNETGAATAGAGMLKVGRMGWGLPLGSAVVLVLVGT